MKTAMENYLFWSEEVEEGQDLKSRAAHHHQEFPGVPPPPPSGASATKLSFGRHEARKKTTDFYLKVGDSAGN